jgi:hypothetical protein
VFVQFPGYSGARLAALPADFESTVVPLTAESERVVITISAAGQKRAHTKTIKITQFPIVPALALTSYKLQGATLDALAVGSLVDDTYKPPPQAAYIVFSRVRSAQSLAMLCRMTPQLVKRFVPAESQLRELVRLHRLHKQTLRNRGVVADDSPLFPPDAGLDETDPRFRDTGGAATSVSITAAPVELDDGDAGE